MGHEYTLVGRRNGTTVYVDLYNHNTKVVYSASSTDGTLATVTPQSISTRIGEDGNADPAGNSNLDVICVGAWLRDVDGGGVKAFRDNPWQALEDDTYDLPFADAAGGLFPFNPPLRAGMRHLGGNLQGG